ncbi:DUF4398 domain-containing protein [Sorangium sp. So ce1036]|uniref:DUF4398 domain-containing protein n=1 Tax=Sorangium sp. So ce1036 TaxID=3133328 RepID=UPI003F044E5B
MREAVIVTFVCASAAGCAARAPAFSERFSASQASIRAAEEVGAEAIPRADAHLHLAREQVQRARRLSAEGAGERAQLMLMRAQADAELALAYAREARAEARAHEALAEVEAIQHRLR